MKITKLEVRKVNAGTMIASVNIVFDHMLEVRDIKLVQSEKGDKKLFISMPQRKYKDKNNGEEKYIDIVSISYFYQNYLKDIIIERYNSSSSTLRQENNQTEHSPEPDVKNEDPLDETIPF